MGVISGNRLPLNQKLDNLATSISLQNWNLARDRLGVEAVGSRTELEFTSWGEWR